MCVFAGILSTAPGSMDSHYANFPKMAQPTRHSGPDDTGILADVVVFSLYWLTE